MERKKSTILERFFTKVNKTETCWLWISNKNSGGYGQFSVNSRHVTAHRWYYEFINGKVSKSLDLDHLCRVRNCVNPEHLEPVTRQENCLRGIGPKLAMQRMLVKTHCPYGHSYDSVNTSPQNYKTGKGRRCLTCHRIREAKRRKLNQTKETI